MDQRSEEQSKAEYKGKEKEKRREEEKLSCPSERTYNFGRSTKQVLYSTGKAPQGNEQRGTMKCNQLKRKTKLYSKNKQTNIQLSTKKNVSIEKPSFLELFFPKRWKTQYRPTISAASGCLQKTL